MLNAKWFILPGGEGQPPRAQQNPAAFGNAWLVSSIQQVPTNDAEFAALGATPNLKGTAIVHQDFSEVVAGLQPNGSGTVQLTKYTPDELSYTFNSPSEQLVVFSEMWYGPRLDGHHRRATRRTDPGQLPAACFEGTRRATRDRYDLRTQ